MFRSLVVAAALSWTSVAVAADVPAEAIYNLREASFMAMASHMKALKILATTEGAPIEEAKLHAGAIRDLSSHIPVWFPKGTGVEAVPKTEALPKIWEDAEGFKAAATQLGTAATAVLAALDAKDMAAFKTAFGSVGKACGSCHDGYRKPDEH